MRSATTALCLAFFAAALLGTGACGARSHLEPARDVDLSRFSGHWYVIARLPPPSRHPSPGAQVEYRFRDHQLEEAYSAHGGTFDGPIERTQVQMQPDSDLPARWRIKQGWFGSRERLVLYVSPSYRRAIVSDGEHEGVWVLAREPEIPEWSLDGLLVRLSLEGFDVSKLKRVVQKPEQVGKTGFE